MAFPSWFDPAYYAAQKIEQMNIIRYKGQSNWDETSYTNELNTWRGIDGSGLPGATSADKAYVNFIACNTQDYDQSIPASAINVSPNQYFIVGEYIQGLVDYANRVGLPGAATPSGGWTSGQMLSHLFRNLRTSAWEHYTDTGMELGINPSNAFSTSAYLAGRAEAMNAFNNGRGWQGKTDWTAKDALNELQASHTNAVQDYFDIGRPVFDLSPQPAAAKVEVAEGWNPWVSSLPPDPYNQNLTEVEMTASQSDYQGQAGVNTMFKGHWTDAAATSTISPGDHISGGINAANTLSIILDAPWQGFSGNSGPNVQNIGRMEAVHGDLSPSTPYTFDGANIQNAERYDIVDNGSGAISLKNLGDSVKIINIASLTSQANDATQPTEIDFASRKPGQNDSLTLGVNSVGSAAGPAPIKMNGIENLTINALAGENYLNLQTVTGVKTLNITGDGNLVVSALANGVASYDASSATGSINIAASDLGADATIKGGLGIDTLTLTKNFYGTPANWTSIDAIAINPGVTATIGANNITGLQSLWVNSNQPVSLNGITAGAFYAYQANSGADSISVNGGLHTLYFSTANFAASAGQSAAPKLTSNVSQNATIHANGAGILAGNLPFDQAKGAINLMVNQDAAFGGTISAKTAASFTAAIDGSLNSGAVFNVVDTGNSGSVALAAKNGVEASSGKTGSITLDADAANELDISSEGSFSLARGSSLANLETLRLELNGNGVFSSAQAAMPKLTSAEIAAGGMDVTLGNLGSSNLHNTLVINVNDAQNFTMGNIELGSGANLTANIASKGGAIKFGNITTASNGSLGDAHIEISGDTVTGSPIIKAADIYINQAEVTGAAFSSGGVKLAAMESINYTGAQGAETVTIQSVGSLGPSTVNLGTGADTLNIGAGAIKAGQRVSLQIDLGADTDSDIISLGAAQGSSSRLGMFVNEFHQGEDSLAGFKAAVLSTAQAAEALAAYGIVNMNITANMLTSFTTQAGRGTGIMYGGDVYAFNSAANPTAMVSIIGTTGNVDATGPALPSIPEDGG